MVGELSEISLKVNGTPVKVSAKEVPASMSLARFVRDRLSLTGTKISCGQGGCGACVVVVEVGGAVRSVNSCLIPLMSCDGWSVTTVEGLGSTRDGLSAEQDRLSRFHGTQCGFCTPGMVMSMHGLRRRKAGGGGEPELEDVENVLDGNLCRCTGYRPILDAWKSFSPDAPDDLKKKLADIEDLDKNAGKTCPKSGAPCKGTCGSAEISGALGLVATAGTDKWYQPKTLQELLAVIKEIPEGASYKLVGGNTGAGIYDDEQGVYQVYVDVNRVRELRIATASPPLALGGSVTLAEAMEAMTQVAAADPAGFFYMTEMVRHWGKVANTAVRAAGTIAGNLMLKHRHREFPSDLFLDLEAAGAQLIVVDTDGTKTRLTPEQWLGVSMTRKVIYQIVFPSIGKDEVFRSFKITPRSQNAHAYVNGSLRAKVKRDGSNFVLVGKPTLVFGGISASFVHASKTEEFLRDKIISDEAVFNGALKVLEQEVSPSDHPVEASVGYRKHLTQAILYKFVLSILGDAASEKVRSGADGISRGISRGDQSYRTDPSIYPLSKPIPKLESRVQCSGEAEYFGDVAPVPGELHAAFVLAARGNCELDAVDAAAALSQPGVVAFVDHKDIPGANQGTMGDHPSELFSTGRIRYAGQSVGVVVAETPDAALKAAKLVKVTYKNAKKPVLTIREALKEPGRITRDSCGPERIIGDIDPFDENIESKFDEPVRIVKGEFEIGTQHHFHLENHTTLVRPIEDGQYEVHSATQWMNMTQKLLSKTLGVPLHMFDMKVRRLGGAYGGKIDNCNLGALACAVAAQKLRRPVRLVMDIKTQMESVGKRLPYLTKYRIVVNSKNKLMAVGLNIYCDTGHVFNSPTSMMAAVFAQNVYAAKHWKVVPYAVATSTAANTYVRSPGTAQGHAIIENAIEHAAIALGLDPLEFRMNNLLKKGDSLLINKPFNEEVNPIIDIIEQVKVKGKYDDRKLVVEQFNRANRWKKRGLSLVPVRYTHNYFGMAYSVLVSIYADDGTVVVTTGGIEMGQGLNTKVAQTVAKTFGITMDMVRVRPSNNVSSPNDSCTGGSFGSEGCMAAALVACQELMARIKKVKTEMDNHDPTWQEAVAEAKKKAVDLTYRHFGHPSKDGHEGYTVWGAIMHEVEVDVLTGEVNIRRTDLVEDTGTSVSPEVDVGQVEGGYVMSLGMWLTERAKYDEETGRLLSNSTWDYKPPASQDIPEDLRTTFYDTGRNPAKILGSKATGEPCVLLGVGVMFAIRDAVNSARRELGEDGRKWFKLDGPATVESIQLASGVSARDFTL